MEHGEDMAMEDAGMDVAVVAEVVAVGDVVVVADFSDPSWPKTIKVNHNSPTSKLKTALSLPKMTNQHPKVVKRKRKQVNGVDFGEVAEDVDVEDLEI